MSKLSKVVKRLKLNRSYSSSEIYENFQIHPQTLRSWVKDKTYLLEVIQKKPLLVFSETLRGYLKDKIERRKFPTKQNELSCFGCKKAKTPLKGKVCYLPVGNMTLMKGICPVCYKVMNKTQSTKRLTSISPLLKRITVEELNILGRTNSKEKTHLKENCKSSSSEYEKKQLNLNLLKVK